MKKFIPIVLCLAVALSVAGCTKNKQNKNNTSTGAQTTADGYDTSREDVVTFEFDENGNIVDSDDSTTNKNSTSKSENSTKKQENTTKEQGTTGSSGSEQSTTQNGSSEGITTPIIPLP